MWTAIYALSIYSIYNSQNVKNKCHKLVNKMWCINTMECFSISFFWVGEPVRQVLAVAWTGTCGSPPVSASRLLSLKACATTLTSEFSLGYDNFIIHKRQNSEVHVWVWCQYNYHFRRLKSSPARSLLHFFVTDSNSDHPFTFPVLFLVQQHRPLFFWQLSLVSCIPKYSIPWFEGVLQY